jgi:hypothetical protein
MREVEALLKFSEGNPKPARALKKRELGGR